MSIKRALAIALAAAAALPASAAAQNPVTPPEADAYLDSYIFNAQQPLRVADGTRAISANTTSYTLQDDMFVPPGPSGGPSEPRVCEGYSDPRPYGNTIWAAFKSGQYGRMNIEASSGNFDEVIRVVPFDSLEDAAPILPGICFDDFFGTTEKASGLVSPNEWYAIQVGGTATPSMPAQGGPMQLSVEMRPPPKVAADALLFWKRPPLRVTSLTVQGVTKGAKITMTCTKGACKKTTKTSSKPITNPTAFRRIATAARTKFTLLKNRKVKKGATITVRVTAPGFVGKHFFWRVNKNSVSNKRIRCTNPGSSKPRKLGTCRG